MLRKEIIVTVRRRDGRVETRSVVVDKAGGGDLVTLWGFRLICCLFAKVPRGDTLSFDFVDLTGTSRSQFCIHFQLHVMDSQNISRRTANTNTATIFQLHVMDSRIRVHCRSE